MIVQCAKCGTKFRLDETKIGQRGAKVRCSKCQHSFVVKRPPPVSAPVALGFSPDTDPTARVRVEDAKPKPPVALDAAATVPGGFDLDDEPTTDLTAVPGFGGAPTDPANTAPSGFATDPELPRITDPDIPGLPLPGGPELPDLPGASELPELPGADEEWAKRARDPIHEVQTAVYMVPESIRAAALKKEEEEKAAGLIPQPGLSAKELAAIDLDGDDDDRTGIVPPEVLAQARAAAAPPAIEDIPSADADLLDDDEVTLVSDDGRDPAEGLDALPGDPFANAPSAGGLPPVMDPAAGLDALPGDPFASASPGGGLPGDLFADAPAEGALGRIQPAVVGGGGAPPAEELAGAGLAIALEPETTKPSPPEPELAAVDGRKGWSLGVKLVTTVVGVAILGVGVLLWMGGGRLDLSLIGLGKGGKVKARAATHYKNVYPMAMRSVLYPTRAGTQVLVFVGRAENRAGETRRDVAAVAELRNQKGEVVASARAPVGLALDPAHVADLTDPASLTRAYSTLAAEQGAPTLPSRGVAPFTVVMLHPPKGLAELEHTVRLDKGEPVVVPKVEPAEQPEPAVEPEEEEDRKGKRKRKGKRRRRKGKAKATAEEE